MEWSGAHGVTEGRLGEQSCAVVRILDVRDRDRRVVHAVVDDRVHRHSYAVFRQYLRVHRFIYIYIYIYIYVFFFLFVDVCMITCV